MSNVYSKHTIWKENTNEFYTLDLRNHLIFYAHIVPRINASCDSLQILDLGSGAMWRIYQILLICKLSFRALVY
jgi:hypothetical protein